MINVKQINFDGGFRIDAEVLDINGKVIRQCSTMHYIGFPDKLYSYATYQKYQDEFKNRELRKELLKSHIETREQMRKEHLDNGLNWYDATMARMLDSRSTHVNDWVKIWSVEK